MKRKMQRPLHEVFNDGFLNYGRNQTLRSETKKRIGETFTSEGRLAFKLLSAREEDYQMAGSMGASLDLKVKTRFPPSFKNVKKNSLKVKIENLVHDVISVDRGGQYLYFYLQEVGVVDE